MKLTATIHAGKAGKAGVARQIAHLTGSASTFKDAAEKAINMVLHEADFNDEMDQWSSVTICIKREEWES